MMQPITPKDLEKLLRESEQIAKDWESYLQFCRKRDAVVKKYMPEEALN